MIMPYAFFGVRPGEERKVLLCLLHAIAIGVIQCILAVVPLSIYLMEHEASGLPVIYIGVSLIILSLGVIHSFLEKKGAVFSVLKALMVLMLIPLALLTALRFIGSGAWISILLLIWSQVIWWVSDLEFWGLLNHLLNLEQGKRLFGLIGTASSLASVVTGLAIAFMQPYVKGRFFLLIAVAMLLCCFWIIYRLSKFEAASGEPEHEVKQAKISIRENLKIPYIAYLFLFCFVIDAVYYFVDVSFNTAVKDWLQTEESMGVFFGFFFAIANGFELLCRFFAFPWLMHRFGILATAKIFPLILTGITFGALAFSLLPFPWTYYPLLALIVTNKLFDEGVRFSLLEPAKVLFFQTLMPQLRWLVQAQAEFIVHPVAAVLSALTILLIAHSMSNPIVLYLVLALALAISSLLFLRLLKQPYMTNLAEALAKRYLSSGVYPLEKNITELLVSHLDSPYPGEVLYSLQSLENTDETTYRQMLYLSLSHPAPLVKQYVLEKLRNLNMRDTLSEVEELAISENEDLFVRAEAIITLAALDGATYEKLFAQFLEDKQVELRSAAIIGILLYLEGNLTDRAFLVVEQFANSPYPSKRAEAAFMVSKVPYCLEASQLRKLLHDRRSFVRQEAVKALATQAFPDLYDDLPKLLEDLAIKEEVVRTCLKIGAPLIPVFAEKLPSASTELKKVQVDVLQSMSFAPSERQNAANFLIGQLRKYGTEFDSVVWIALARLHYRIDDRLSAIWEEDVDNEVYRLSELLEILAEMPDKVSVSYLRNLIEEQVAEGINLLFTLLSMHYPQALVLGVQEGLRSDEKREYANELLQSVLNMKHSAKIPALIAKIYFRKHQSHVAIVSAFLRKMIIDEAQVLNALTRATALYILAKSQPVKPEFLEQVCRKEDPLLRETCDWVLTQ